MEIEDLRVELKQLDEQMAAYEKITYKPIQSEIDLTPQIGAKALKKIAKAAGVAVEDIRIIATRQGSIVLEVEMPLAGAARLMALRQVNHPQLQREGITDVELDQERSTLKTPQLDKLAEAVNFEINDLQGDNPSDESPYAKIRGTVPLRVTIDPDKIA